MDPDYVPDYTEEGHARAQQPVPSTSGRLVPRGPGSGLMWWQKANRRAPGRRKKGYYRLKPEVFDDPDPEIGRQHRVGKFHTGNEDYDEYQHRRGRGQVQKRSVKALTIRNIVGSPDYVPELDNDFVVKNKMYLDQDRPSSSSASGLTRERQYIDHPPPSSIQKKHKRKRVRYQYDYSSSPTSDSDLESEGNRAANAILKETKPSAATTNEAILSQYPDLEITDDYTAQILKTLPVPDLVTLLNSVGKGSNSVLSVQSCVEENGETTIYVVEEERGPRSQQNPSDITEESSESLVPTQTDANGEHVTSVALDEDPDQFQAGHDGNELQPVTDMSEILRPPPPPLQPAPDLLLSKGKAANYERYKYKSLAGNKEPSETEGKEVQQQNSSQDKQNETTVAQSGKGYKSIENSDLGTHALGQPVPAGDDIDQSILQQAMETMNPSAGAEVKPLMPLIYYKCKGSNQIFSVPVTHDQAISIAAGRAEYRPDLGKVLPLNKNKTVIEPSLLKGDDSVKQAPSRSAIPQIDNSERPHIDIRPPSPMSSSHSPGVTPSQRGTPDPAATGAGTSADLGGPVALTAQIDDEHYEVNIAEDINSEDDDDDDNDDDDEIEIEIQTDEHGNIIGTNTLHKKADHHPETSNSSSNSNASSPVTTSHPVGNTPHTPILYNAAHIQHNLSNQDVLTNRNSLSAQYSNSVTADYENIITNNTLHVMPSNTSQLQQSMLQLPSSKSSNVATGTIVSTHPVSTHSIACGEEPINVRTATSATAKPHKESRTIAIQTSPIHDASDDDHDNGASVGIQTQTSPIRRRRRKPIVLTISDSDDDLIEVNSRSNMKVTEWSDSEIPLSPIAHDTIYPLYAYQIHYEESLWRAYGLNIETDFELYLSDGTATNSNPDLQFHSIFSPSDVTSQGYGATDDRISGEYSGTESKSHRHDSTADDHLNTNVVRDTIVQNQISNETTEINIEMHSTQVSENCEDGHSMDTIALPLECSSSGENQLNVNTKDAGNSNENDNNLEELFKSVTPLDSPVTPLSTNVDDESNNVVISNKTGSIGSSTGHDAVTSGPGNLNKVLESALYSHIAQRKPLGIGRKAIRIGRKNIRINQKPHLSDDLTDDIDNDADVEDDEFDDDDYDNGYDDEDYIVDPPEYPSFTGVTGRTSTDGSSPREELTDDGTETEPGDENPNSEGWDSKNGEEPPCDEARSVSKELSQGDTGNNGESATSELASQQAGQQQSQLTNDDSFTSDENGGSMDKTKPSQVKESKEKDKTKHGKANQEQQESTQQQAEKVRSLPTSPFREGGSQVSYTSIIYMK